MALVFENTQKWQDALYAVLDGAPGLSGPEAAALLKRNRYNRDNPGPAVDGAIAEGQRILAARPPKAAYRRRA